LEILSLSLNNSKGFSKQVMIFSEFQAFRIIVFAFVDNPPGPRSAEDDFISGGVSLDRQGQWGSRRIWYGLVFMRSCGGDAPQSDR
jgi:hypothetical protein